MRTHSSASSNKSPKLVYSSTDIGKSEFCTDKSDQSSPVATMDQTQILTTGYHDDITTSSFSNRDATDIEPVENEEEETTELEDDFVV